MTDSSEIGRFGTLRLLKRHDPNTTIAFFPVDDEEVTFGRNNKCSVRLYYAFVSEVHCILQISEERKAFLIVKGSNGVTIDGCEVLPTQGQSQDPVVPLTNGSEIEIHTKKFKFEYPPKEIRAALLATPRPSPKHSRRRSLRMSMISSAQISTPQKGKFSSPLKTAFPTPSQRLSLSRLVGMDDEKEELKDQSDVLKTPINVPAFLSEEREILLVEGSGEDALVLEEDKDLIILEHIDEQGESPVSPIIEHGPKVSSVPTTPKSATILISQTRLSSVPAAKPQAFQTPSRNPRRSGISLHRAVVLRSAHRAHWEQERQRSLEQEEEEEVELAVSPERDLGPFELCEDDESGGCGVELEFQEDNEDNEVNSDESEDESEDEGSSGGNATHPLSSPRSAYSGPFEALKAKLEMVKKMTFEKSPERAPQTDDGRKVANKSRSPSPIRRIVKTDSTTPATPNSKLAQRVPADVTKPGQTFSGGEQFPFLFGGARRVAVPARIPVETETATSSGLEALSQRTPDAARTQISQEERDAIYKRRRSALLTPTAVLPPPGPRSSNIKPTVNEDEEYIPGKDCNEDSETMLEKMKVKLESVQRRNEARKARLSYASPQRKGGFLDFGMPSLSLPPPPPHVGVQSRTLRMAEESLRQMKLEDDDDKAEKKTTVAPNTSWITPSLGVEKELFTNSRTWVAAAATQTPSFVGMRNMFKVKTAIMATPNMKLDEVFYEADEHEDEDVGESDHSDEHEQEVLEAIEAEEPVNMKATQPQSPLTSTSTQIEKTASRLPSRRGVRRKIPERTSPCGNAQSEPMHPTKRVMRKVAAEPLIEVQNSHGKFGGGGGSTTNETGDAQSSSTVFAPPSTRRVTRSRNVKAVNEEIEPAIPTAKRATRQTKKQEVIEQHSEETGKTRRGGQTKKQAAVQSKQDDAGAPKLTQRRRTRLK